MAYRVMAYLVMAPIDGFEWSTNAAGRDRSAGTDGGKEKGVMVAAWFGEEAAEVAGMGERQAQNMNGWQHR